MRISKGEPQPFPELRGTLAGMRYPAYVEPKIDGELNWFKYIDSASIWKDHYLINKSGKMRLELPITKELDEMGIDQNLLGELHWGEGKSGALYEFLKHQKDDELRFTVFDVNMPGTYEERSKWLGEHIKDTKHVQLVDHRRMLSKDGVMEAYRDYTDDCYEGIVVKSADSRLIMGPCPWVKLKHRTTIIGVVSEIDTSLERIEFIYKGHAIGLKCANVTKRTLKIGDEIEVEHQGELSQGGLRHPVYIRKVGEK